ncbi:MAG: aspartate kinase, partial [Bacteroidota bacterium]
MKVYKFGGGVIQDPKSIRKLAQLIQTESGPLVVVVSALGKTTQALEAVLRCQVAGRPYTSQLQALHQFYQDIVDELLDGSREAAYEVLATWQEELLDALALPITDAAFDKAYSCVVAQGELLTSKLIDYYLQEQKMACTWLDARDYVKTSSGFCNAQVDWVATQRLVQKNFLPPLEQGSVILTQGFIGSDAADETTTLGKEGSD